jgi:membrane-associated progesterone receptor component
MAQLDVDEKKIFLDGNFTTGKLDFSDLFYFTFNQTIEEVISSHYDFYASYTSNVTVHINNNIEAIRDETWYDQLHNESVLITTQSNTIGDYISFIFSGKVPMLSMIAWTCAIGFVVWLYMTGSHEGEVILGDNDDEKEEEPIVRRDFTLDQLRAYTGAEDKPIYIALEKTVYDVSEAKHLYGDGCSYHMFAGREASRALAKLSFEEEDLASTYLGDLSKFELDNLNNYVHKFKYFKKYPIVGFVVIDGVPTKDTPLESLPVMTDSDILSFNGKQTSIPEGRICAPIYIGLSGRVLDVSFGGVEFYGPGGPYEKFAGYDISRALAVMKVENAEIENKDISDLTEKQLKILKDWEKSLYGKYPCIARLVRDEKV